MSIPPISDTRSATRAGRIAWRCAARVVAVSWLASAAVAAAAPVPSGRFDYRVSWNGIAAATAAVDVAREESGGEPRYRVEATVRTSWLVDLLWHFRGRAASRFTGDHLTPLGFLYDREENREHSVTDVVFDPATPQATGTRWRRGRSVVLGIQEADVVDPITAIFRALSQPVRLGETSHYEVFTGESRYRIELQPLGEETVTVAAGTFQAWRIEPRIWRLGSGPDRRLHRATIWVTQEPVHTLLRIRSEVFIGAVNCDLLHVEKGDAPPAG